MKKLILSIIAIILVLYVAVSDKTENTIVIYSALEQYRNDDLAKHLKEKFPDNNIQIMYLPTAKVAAKIKSEKTNTDADIILGVENGYMEMIVDSLADVNQYSHLDYLDGMNPEHHKYVIWESYGGGFAINTQILNKLGLKEPKTYQDLLDPQYRNLIALQDPKSSSTGYNFYLSLYNIWGINKTLYYYDQLNENVKQYSESGSGPVKLLVQGECAIATALTYQVVSEMNKGNPLKMIFPPEGSPYSLDGVSMIKGREENENIVAIFEYIINDYLIYDKEMYNPGQILKEQNSNLPNYPKDIQYADMTHLENLSLKEKLLKKWKY